MAQLKYTPPRQSSPAIHVPQQLQDCEFIFVRNDAVKKPLTPTYQGPFKVLKRSEKHLTIDRGSRTDTISIDRVKPAFLEKSPRETEPVSTHPEPSPASTTTQSQLSKPRSEPIPESPITPPKQTRLGRKRHRFLLYEPSYLYPETSRRFLTGLGEQEASLFATLTLPVKSTKPSSCRDPAAVVQTVLFRANFRMSFDHPLRGSSTAPALLHLPARPATIPAPADDLIQCPLTSSARYRPDTVQTTSVCLPSTVCE
ncbi:unnamed protein product [Acanthosepion pharaonis]|uniref:Uncharacterized protein n=1 Tax=Acanthosepion pharaonis TaxID=158019 RepID=A0A812B3E5_ACAPH|nr:unnamed protein product [Sepia pharaonis]